MGNAIHFRLDHPSTRTVRVFSLQRNEVCHADVMRHAAALIKISPGYTATFDYENKYDKWLPLFPGDTTAVVDLAKWARAKGTAGDPIRLRLVTKRVPVTDDIVYFDIPDYKRGDVRFMLPLEGVTLAALLSEAVARYGQGATLRWESGDRWVRVDNDTDLAYMKTYCDSRAVDGRMLITLQVSYTITEEGYKPEVKETLACKEKKK